jgi:hypothetical protein
MSWVWIPPTDVATPEGSRAADSLPPTIPLALSSNEFSPFIHRFPPLTRPPSTSSASLIRTLESSKIYCLSSSDCSSWGAFPLKTVIHKLGLENLAQAFSFFSHNESKALSKRRELCKFF